MQSYEGLIRILNAANIKYVRKETGSGCEIHVLATAGPRNEGFEGLYTTFVFTKEGDLDSMGVWDNQAA